VKKSESAALREEIARLRKDFEELKRMAAYTPKSPQTGTSACSHVFAWNGVIPPTHCLICGTPMPQPPFPWQPYYPYSTLLNATLPVGTRVTYTTNPNDLS